MSDFLKEWQTTKKEFEKNTGKKKPSETIMGFFRKSSGIESALKTLDAAHAAMDKTNNEKNMDTLEKALAKYVKEKDAYIKILNDSIAKEKDADSSYAKGLQVLKSDLKAIQASAEQRIAYFKSAAAAHDTKTTMAENMLVTLEACCKRAGVAINKVKAAPSAKLYNSFFPKAARDITQQIGNVEKLRKEGHVIKGGGGTKELFDGLVPWANSPKILAEDTAEDEVLKQIGAFEKAVRDVVVWYKAAQKS